MAACESDYIAQLQQRNIPVTSDSAQDILEKTNVEGTIAEIRTAVLDGDSWYYVRLDGADTFYAMAASKDRNVVILNVGDAVSIQISPEDSGNAIVNALSISTGNAAPDPVKEEPDKRHRCGRHRANDAYRGVTVRKKMVDIIRVYHLFLYLKREQEVSQQVTYP